jgi:anthranilate synthase component I
MLKLPQCPDFLALAATKPQRYPALFESTFGEPDSTCLKPYPLAGIAFLNEQCRTSESSFGPPHSKDAKKAWDFLAVASGERIVADTPSVRFFDALDAHTRDVFVCFSKRVNGELVCPGKQVNGEVLAQPSTERDGADAPPFCGGWVVYLGYEMAGEIEPTLRQPAPPFAFPRAFALRTPCVLARDRHSGEAFLCCESGFEALCAAVLADLAELKQLKDSDNAPASRNLSADVTEDASGSFLHGVQRVQDYLAAGDVFQVNLSRAWRAELAPDTDAAAVYTRLRASNPAPFSALVQLDQYAVISSSPERLIAAKPDAVGSIQVQTRPIAGTRARAPGEPAMSALEKQRFIGDVKEHAEHIMLIDLERNDLGRVCAPGSVEVDELLSVESYAHVHHLVSNVRGTLRPGVSPVQLLKAVFPGGTITGCPKVRCMEIIAELELTGRGPYTGALGYIGSNGYMDFNILIRTFAKSGNTLHFRAGAGIVMDSQPEKELAETRAKAKGLLRALM